MVTSDQIVGRPRTECAVTSILTESATTPVNWYTSVIVQIKHLALTEEIAEDICTSLTADRIVIVCKKAEAKLITSLLTQIGWKSRIQSIVTEGQLVQWYERALRGNFSDAIGDKLLKSISDEIALEFPSADNSDFMEFYKGRGYDKLSDDVWK